MTRWCASQHLHRHRSVHRYTTWPRVDLMKANGTGPSSTTLQIATPSTKQGPNYTTFASTRPMLLRDFIWTPGSETFHCNHHRHRGQKTAWRGGSVAPSPPSNKPPTILPASQDGKNDHPPHIPTSRTWTSTTHATSDRNSTACDYRSGSFRGYPAPTGMEPIRTAHASHRHPIPRRIPDCHLGHPAPSSLRPFSATAQKQHLE